MTRPSSDLTPQARLLIVTRAMSGEVLSPWWLPNWSGARAHAVSASGGWMDRDSHGERKADGVHVWFSGEGKRYHGPPASLHEHNFESRVREPDIIMPWSEVRDIILAGASQDRRARYNLVYGQYCGQACTGLPNPPLRAGQRRERGLPEEDNGDYQKDPANLAYWAEGRRIREELNAAGYDIIGAGCEILTEREAKRPAQLGLW